MQTHRRSPADWDSLHCLGPDCETYRGIPVVGPASLHALALEVLLHELPWGGSVAELGSGYGALAQRLADFEFDVVGFEVLPTLFAAVHPNLDFEAVDLDDDFAAGRESLFDAVVVLELLMHTSRPRHLLRAAADLLVPGGRCLVSVPTHHRDRVAGWAVVSGFRVLDDVLLARRRLLVLAAPEP